MATRRPGPAPAPGAGVSRWLLILGLLAVTTGLTPAPARAAAANRGAGPADEALDRVMHLVDARGRELLSTGLGLEVGDRFVDPQDWEYRVVRVQGDRAVAVRRGRVKRARGGAAPGALSIQAQLTRLVAVYHTHSDESYEPNSGTASKPWNGDIFRVGTELSNLLRGLGVRVYHDATRHDPHDGLAYLRSRRTAARLLRQRPDALFDIHRDTPPAHTYLSWVKGERLARVLMVVGQQNPLLPANQTFAFALKAYADQHFPGLVQGILFKNSDYNQDLHPRSLLLEVGTTHNTLADAERGIQLFGRVVAGVLYGIPPSASLREPAREAARRREAAEHREGLRQLFLLLTLTGAGLVLYWLMGEESLPALGRGWARLSRRLPRHPRAWLRQRIPRGWPVRPGSRRAGREAAGSRGPANRSKVAARRRSLRDATVLHFKGRREEP